MNPQNAPGSKKTTTTTTVTSLPRKAQARKPNASVNKKPSPVPGPRMAYNSVKASTKAGTRRLNRNIAGLVSSFTLPKEIEPIRIGNAYGSDKTAVAKLFRKVNVKSPGAGAASVIPKENFAAFAFRDPLRSFVYNYGILPTDNFNYVSTGASFPTAVETDVHIQYDGPLTYDGLGTVAPHGPDLYPGRLGPSDPNRGWLVSPFGRIRLQISARPAATTGNYIIKLMHLQGASWSEAPIPYATIPQVSGGTVDINPTDTGYYSWSIFVEKTSSALPISDNPCLVSVGHTANSGNMSMVWAQQPLPKIEDVLDSIRNFRIPSVSLMFTNTASPLNRQGQIVGLQLPKETQWFDFIEFDSLTGTSKAQTLNIVNGMYGFLKPTSPSDLDMRTCVYLNVDEENEYVFDLFPRTDYLTIQANVTIPDGRQGYFTPAHHIEFETLSQWFDSDESPLNKDDLDTALRVVGRLPQWHENDLHFSDIWEGIKSFASSAWDGVKEMASAVAPFAPLVPLLL